MNRFLAFALLWALTAAGSAFAELSEVTVAAVIKSFDDATVTVQIHKKELRVSRNQLSKGQLQVGTAIFLTFRGSQVQELLKELASHQAHRQPASKSAQHP